MGRKRNDATLSKLGDIYQYFIALLDCFKLKAGEKIQIEQQGDVTLLSGNNSRFQKEVKHHTGSSKLSDRDVDLWNTLKNWILDYSDSVAFDQLILFTTADIAATSVFCNWNTKDKKEKYDILYKIGERVKESEEVFRGCYNTVFNCGSITKEQICNLFDKFQLEHLRPKIHGLSIPFSTYLVTIPEANRDNYIAALLGTIFQPVVKPPHIWEISFELFQDQAQTIAAAYMKEEKMPLPLDFLSVEPDSTDYKLVKEKRFVRALEDIEYNKIISRAISDYWKATKTIARYFSDNISYTSSLTAYRKSLGDRMFYAKESVLSSKPFTGRSQELSASQKLCSDVLGWSAEDFGSIVANQSFFKNGIVHSIVDDKEFIWDVGDENESKEY